MIKIGDVLSNRYRITGRIGTGGTAEVYLATDFIKKETVAVKIIKEELINDPRSVARFEHEAAACVSYLLRRRSNGGRMETIMTKVILAGQYPAHTFPCILCPESWI